MNLIFLLICYLLISLNVLAFALWPQVIELYQSNIEFNQIFSHPHGMRYFLVLPLFIISEWLGVNYDLLFTLIAPLLLLLIVFFVKKQILFLRQHVSKKQKIFLSLFLMICILVVASNMNGRILFALLGFSILSFVLVFWDSLEGGGKAFWVICGLMLMSVSSGTFIIGVCSIALFSLYKVFNGRGKKELFFFLVFTLGLIYFLPLIISLIMKNIDYFGNILLMLNHGYGQILKNSELVILCMLVATFIIFLLIQVFLIHLYKKYLIIFYLLGISIFIGAFGYSALAMSLIPLFIIIGSLFLFGFSFLENSFFIENA